MQAAVEIQCIKKYLQNHNVKHIPVDIEPSQNLSFRELDCMFGAFGKYDVYKRIQKQHYALEDMEGFGYLNSKKCLEVYDELKIAEKQAIEFSGIHKNTILEIYQLFNESHDNRENAMLLNIYNYSKENQYNEAVFLLSYANKKSMTQKLQSQEKKENLKLNWTFYKTSQTN